MLANYLSGLSEITKSRFGPHAYDYLSILNFYRQNANRIGYVALDESGTNVIAYAIIQIGFLSHDQPRLEGYGITLHAKTDATFAPSVADAWQGQGVGTQMLHFILADLKTKGVLRLILWGGVQADNSHAVNYYHKLGFTTLGQFSYYGENYDMCRWV
jgi:GNAT superfamily N-acetyltransferase